MLGFPVASMPFPGTLVPGDGWLENFSTARKKWGERVIE
jgi:hypothetical protein